MRCAAVAAAVLASAVQVSADACGDLAAKSNGLVTVDDVFPCYKAFELTDEIRKKTATALKSYFDFYPYLDLAKNSQAPLYPSQVDLYAQIDRLSTDPSITTLFEYNSRLTDAVASLHDAHAFYQVGCFTAYRFVQPWVFAARYPEELKGSPEIVLARAFPEGTFTFSDEQRLQNPFLNEVAAQLDKFWGQALGKPAKDFIGYKVVSVDDVDTATYIQNFTDRLSGIAKDPDARFNYVLSYQNFENGKFTPRDGLFSRITYPPFDFGSKRKYRLKSPAGDEVTVDAPWAGYFWRPMTNITDNASYYKAFCRRPLYERLASADGPGVISRRSETPGNGVERFREGVEFPLTSVGGAKLLTGPAVDVAKTRLAATTRLAALPMVLKHASAKSPLAGGLPEIKSLDLGKPIVGDGDGAFYILDDKTTGVWVFPSVLPTTLTEQGLGMWLATIFMGLLTFEDLGVQNLIIDASRNGGGLLCGADVIASFLFPNVQPQQFDMRLSPSSEYHLRNSANLAPNPLGDVSSLFDISAFRSVDASRSSILEPGQKITRGGVEGKYTNRFYFDGCANFTKGVLASIPKLNKGWKGENMVVLSDGICGSACAETVRRLRDQFKVRSVVYGGRTSKPFQPTAFEGGAVFSFDEILGDSLRIVKASPEKPSGFEPPQSFFLAAQGSIPYWESYSGVGPRPDDPEEWVPEPAERLVRVVDPMDKVALWSEVAKEFKSPAPAARRRRRPSPDDISRMEGEEAPSAMTTNPSRTTDNVQPASSVSSDRQELAAAAASVDDDLVEKASQTPVATYALVRQKLLELESINDKDSKRDLLMQSIVALAGQLKNQNPDCQEVSISNSMGLHFGTAGRRTAPVTRSISLLGPAGYILRKVLLLPPKEFRICLQNHEGKDVESEDQPLDSELTLLVTSEPSTVYGVHTAWVFFMIELGPRDGKDVENGTEKERLQVVCRPLVKVVTDMTIAKFQFDIYSKPFVPKHLIAPTQLTVPGMVDDNPRLRIGDILRIRRVPFDRFEYEKAVQSIIEQKYGEVPFLIWGPPGTGKTKTCIEAIYQILQSNPQHRVLACAPSSSAADTITRRLKAFLQPKQLIRLIAPTRAYTEVPEELLLYTVSRDGHFDLPPIQDVLASRVVVCTCEEAYMLFSAGLSNSFSTEAFMRFFAKQEEILPFFYRQKTILQFPIWTHLFIDEAGQASEAETALPLSVVANGMGSESPASSYFVPVILSGDHMQLGAFVQSAFARHHGFDRSLFERIISRPLYKNHPESRDAPLKSTPVLDDPTLSEPSLILQEVRAPFVNLIRNYRSHPSMLVVPSRLSYNNTLMPYGDPSLTHSLLDLPILPNPRIPILFAGIKGIDDRAGDEGASWWNGLEAAKVLELIEAVAAHPGVEMKDFGVISPFREQVKRDPLWLANLTFYVQNGCYSGCPLPPELLAVEPLTSETANLYSASADSPSTPASLPTPPQTSNNHAKAGPQRTESPVTADFPSKSALIRDASLVNGSTNPLSSAYIDHEPVSTTPMSLGNLPAFFRNGPTMATPVDTSNLPEFFRNGPSLPPTQPIFSSIGSKIPLDSLEWPAEETAESTFDYDDLDKSRLTFGGDWIDGLIETNQDV
ncbi:hypothetical protein HDU96_010520 [Phlyctochytrium bullatum]|nr:hypothetical protein HDU96_010520 [Phlyctochytrium bullatum]